MTYWQNICELQKKQTEKGIRTYGQTLEQNVGLSTADRLVYLEEELIDALMYIEHLKVALNSEMRKSCKSCKNYNHGNGEVICNSCDILCNDLWENAYIDDGK